MQISFRGELAGFEQKPNKDNTKLYLKFKFLSEDGSITECITEDLKLGTNLQRLALYDVTADLFVGSKFTRLQVLDVKKVA